MTGFRMKLLAGLSVALLYCGATECRAEAEAEEAPAEKVAKYRLRYKFEAGQWVRFRSTHTSSITTQFRQAQETATSRTTTGKHYRVISVRKDGSAILEMVIDWVDASIQFGDTPPTTYDSRKKDVEPPDQLRDMAATIGKPTARIEFASHGKLLGNALLAAAPKNQANQKLNADANFLVIFPEPEIAVGQGWHDDYTVPVTVPGARKLKKAIKLRRSYKLLSVDGNMATISMKTSLVTPVQAPQVRAQLIQRQPAGTITFDLERGVIASRAYKTEKSEFGIYGKESSLHVVSSNSEKFVEGAEVAAKSE